MRVCDVMTRSVVTTRPEVAVKDAALILAGHGFTALPVIDADERLVGMLTEADVVRGRTSPDPRRGAWHGSEAGSTAGATVGEVMSSPALSVDPHTDAAGLADTMTLLCLVKRLSRCWWSAAWWRGLGRARGRCRHL
jgi:CBS domain-containing protein